MKESDNVKEYISSKHILLFIELKQGTEKGARIDNCLSHKYKDLNSDSQTPSKKSSMLVHDCKSSELQVWEVMFFLEEKR